MFSSSGTVIDVWAAMWPEPAQSEYFEYWVRNTFSESGHLICSWSHPVTSRGANFRIVLLDTRRIMTLMGLLCILNEELVHCEIFKLYDDWKPFGEWKGKVSGRFCNLSKVPITARFWKIACFLHSLLIRVRSLVTSPTSPFQFNTWVCSLLASLAQCLGIPTCLPRGMGKPHYQPAHIVMVDEWTSTLPSHAIR